MAYDEGLAHRIEIYLEEQAGLVCKKMFGGIAWMLEGNLAVGVVGDQLVVRVGKDAYNDAMAKEHTSPFKPTGRVMTGWVLVSQDGLEEDNSLHEWIDAGIGFAGTLPPK